MITPLFPDPAVLLKTKDTRTLVIADLHIGWEMALSEKGIHVPTQAPKILSKLTGLISVYKPKRLLILGDVKHSVAIAEIGEWHDVPDFFNKLKSQVREICVIRGNHDGNLEPLLPEGIEILPSTGTILGGVGFFHGHRWPSPPLLKCKTLVMGHLHPVVAFRDPTGFRVTKQVWVKANCEKAKLVQTILKKLKTKGQKSSETHDYSMQEAGTSELFIMPSFNDFLGGRPLNEDRIGPQTESRMIAGPVLRSEAVDLKNADLYLLDGTFLGTLNQASKANISKR